MVEIKGRIFQALIDAQRANEMVFALAMTTSPRIHERTGGLRADEIEGKDGLRQIGRCPSI